MQLWGGRFSEGVDEQLRCLNDSLPFDRRLYHEDIRGSMAYAQAITEAGILAPEERDRIRAGLSEVHREFEGGLFQFEHGDEDIHSAVERRLTELIGETAGKLHTGRSRNDQVATDLRLWAMSRAADADELIEGLQRAILALASDHLTTIMPGYTHMQPAQPISAAHWLMSFFWMLARDRERLADAQRRIAISPLGAGALAGTPLAVDREALAADLGFDAITQNSLDAVSDRDFVAEFLFVASLVMVHISRLAEDIILFSSPAFGMVRLAERYTTGSSLMPQKRNADPFELARGKAGRVIGHLMALLTVLKGLPSGYNKDLQEDKEGLFDTFDTLAVLIPVLTGAIGSLSLDAQRMRSLLSEDMLATDLADYLVARGMPFRQAHHVVGQVVRSASEQGVALSDLSLDELRVHSDLFDADSAAVFDQDLAVGRRQALGGTSPVAVQHQLEQAQAWLASARTLARPPEVGVRGEPDLRP
jgi:argininosuccinate lyase